MPCFSKVRRRLMRHAFVAGGTPLAKGAFPVVRVMNEYQSRLPLEQLQVMQAGTMFHASAPKPVGRPPGAITGRRWSTVVAGSPQYTHFLRRKGIRGAVGSPGLLMNRHVSDHRDPRARADKDMAPFVTFRLCPLLHTFFF